MIWKDAHSSIVSYMKRGRDLDIAVKVRSNACREVG